MLKLSVSGSYLKDGKSNDYQFDDVFMPECKRSMIQWSAMRRAVPMRLHKSNIPFDHIRSCYVDSVEEVKDSGETMAYETKSIKQYNHEDCQNMAIACGLIGVPAYRAFDLRETLQYTYKEYSSIVMGVEYNKDHPFDYSIAPDIYIKQPKEKSKKTED